MQSLIDNARQSLAILLVLLVQACAAHDQTADTAPNTQFTLAVIPDTQNYLDYTHQQAEGFAFDAAELFIEQMRYVASRSVSKGGDIAFVAAVGDVWQHQSIAMDEDHKARGFKRIHNPIFAQKIEHSDKTRAVELPRAVEGYQLLSDAGLPFGVAPGNHDYDAMWSAEGFPPNMKKPPAQWTMTAEDLGLLHIGGLDNFRSVFGSDSAFFKDKPWYVDSFNGGANSAQLFEAGGYRFLHITLQMQASDEVLAWVETVLARYPGLPTILTTHDYLDTDGERRANPIVDLSRLDPDHHNSAEQLWQKLIAPNAQIFMLLCGHHHGQAMRIDNNAAGLPVYQVLADYQSRGQASIDAGIAVDKFRRRPVGIGDGWLRLMNFDLGDKPTVRVQTYSTHYKRQADQLESYVAWYKAQEKPALSDSEFLAEDVFDIDLADFHQRFKAARLP
jgi:hypothetical protein